MYSQRLGRLPPNDQQICTTKEETIVDVIGVIIAGIIIGLLGKFVAPGDRDNIPLWLTVLCGVGGVLIGYYLAAAFGVEETSGIDWIRWIISIAVAAVLVIIAATVTGRRGHKVQ
ncbi:MAG TPA: GlsB/YeaQ/YmgE family stress response membrane protein [Jiangellaceae bacterium]|nr:GlsB/YeaQ/YmgE family stress response membrane protein [Jiangellaceae bacterium]